MLSFKFLTTCLARLQRYQSWKIRDKRILEVSLFCGGENYTHSDLGNLFAHMKTVIRGKNLNEKAIILTTTCNTAVTLHVWMSVWVSISTRPVQLPVLFSRCFLSQLRKRLPAFIRLSFPPLFPVLPTHTIRSLHQSGPLCQTWSLPVVHWFGFEKRIKQFPPTLWCGPYLRFLLTLAGLCCY